MGNELADKATKLSMAIAEHARIVTASPDDSPAVVAAVNTLRSAALEYAQVCAEATGWGNPFSELESDLEDAEELELDAATVDVEAHYRVRVKDAAVATRLLDEPPEEDLLGATSDVVAQLFLRDGWNPEAYGDDVLEVVSQSWSCGPAMKD
ncbi:hypothetical protein E1295_25575 [Nonomuraea mesophila]|uniref:Uncharacterized protein n=1 Tax=Nonomuraea mesophila TaxID=2530382 RepID=A0A4R5F7V6_9ACTN|nr:hypothetical protein [Nonomuraea mesophila]TDE44113.1 hypothetical protein E1295_25575 [Nonomuraea mesophila]